MKSRLYFFFSINNPELNFLNPNPLISFKMIFCSNLYHIYKHLSLLRRFSILEKVP